jgi:hypothetical protein
MQKRNFGLFLVYVLVAAFVVAVILRAINLEEISPDTFDVIFITVTIAATLSALCLWVMCMWDCIGNKMLSIKSQTSILIALILFNWVASLVYFFKVIKPRGTDT